MKRLLDEGSDSFERSLLQAGSNIRSDGSGKAKLLAVMAAGGLGGAAAVGAREAASWWQTLLATKIGKTAVVGLVVAGSGATLVAVERRSVQFEPAKTPPSHSAESAFEHSNAVKAPLVEPSEPLQGAKEQDVPGEHHLPSASTHAEHATGPVHRSRKLHVAPAAETRAGVKETVEPSALLAEARLVERLRAAVHGGSAAVVDELLGEYRRQFPNGQLRPEVNKLEAQRQAR